MNLKEIAAPCRWQVPNPSARGGELTIGGWDFGGRGPLALLHHANGLCAASWALVAVQLTDRYRVVAMDARGHGDSDHLRVPEDYAWPCFVSDLVAVAGHVLEATGEDEVALGVGSSFGGIVTAAAEAARPGLFRRVVMLDPPIHPSAELLAAMGLESETPFARPPDLVERARKRRAVWDSRDQARTAWQDKPLFAAWDPRAFDIYLSEGMRDRADGQVELKCHPTVEAHIFETTGSLGLLDYAPQVRAPVHLVRASNSFSRASFYAAVAGTFPDGRLSTVEGGHLLPLEVPDRVAQALLAV